MNKLNLPWIITKFLFRTTILGLILGFLFYVCMMVTIVHHPATNRRLAAENATLAIKYHRVVKQHQKLNRDYLLTHGYRSTNTKDNGIHNGVLTIIPYHAKSDTTIEIHTPAMVKLEFQSQALCRQFKVNNQKLTKNNAQPVSLKTGRQKKQPHHRLFFTMFSILFVLIILASLSDVFIAIFFPKYY